MNRSGFTLIEMLVVGAIIGILAGVAIPSYFSYLKRARQVEAPVALNEVKRLEAMFFAFNGSYGPLEDIGYDPTPALRYYNMTVELFPASAGPSTGFKATAAGNLDSDPDEDVWTITEDGTIEHPEVD
jgi:type IV pilus assembly protein PilE